MWKARLGGDAGASFREGAGKEERGVQPLNDRKGVGEGKDSGPSSARALVDTLSLHLRQAEPLVLGMQRPALNL
eukprot:1869095-Rhodomonas_salina.2